MPAEFNKWITQQQWIPSRLKLGLPSVFRLRYGRSMMALVDQALISGSNFAANIVLVRALGLADFGKYYVAYAVILYANALQVSFITTPMLITAPMLDGEDRTQLLNGMLAMQLLASLLLFAIFAVLGAVSRLFTNYYSLPCILAIACSIGTYQLQDWLRRYYFLTGRGNLAIVSDFISYFVQLVILAALAWTRHLTLPLTFWSITLTSAAAFSMGPITDRLRPSMARMRETWAQCKRLSRELLLANQVRWFGDQGILLIGTSIVGATNVGGLRATQSLAGPVNIALTSLDNVLPMKIGELLKTKGTAGAYAYIRKAMIVSTLAMGLVLIPIAIFGRSILRIVYGPAVVAFYIPMLLQLCNMVVGIVTRLWFYFYRGVQDTRAVLRATIVSTLVGVPALFIFGPLWKSTGVALASLSGYLAIAVFCIYHWRRFKDELLLRFPGK